MGAKTNIEWTDSTWNPIGGCSVHSPGCTHCYAQRLCGTRLKYLPLYVGTTTESKAGPVFNGKLTAAAKDAEVWSWPCRWRGSKAPKLGARRPSLIFVGDLSDLFHQDRPLDVIDRVVAGIVYSRHIGQLLTKRTDVMRRYFETLRASGRWLLWKHPLLGKSNFAPEATFEAAIIPRLWLGTSVENQRCADERREHLKAVAEMGFTTFVSYEPAVGPVQWGGWEFIKQLIGGGESGPNPRPSHPDWHRVGRDWCALNGIAYFFKQWGEWAPINLMPRASISVLPDGRVREWDEGAGRLTHPRIALMFRVGKKVAGHLLDGREHREFPA